MLADDVEIQRWVEDRYGFVPHPFWINHCKELYGIGVQEPAIHRKAWHECHPEKRLPIREAFAQLRLLASEEIVTTAVA
jgi:hypothetical protein